MITTAFVPFPCHQIVKGIFRTQRQRFYILFVNKKCNSRRNFSKLSFIFRFNTVNISISRLSHIQISNICKFSFTQKLTYSQLQSLQQLSTGITKDFKQTKSYMFFCLETKLSNKISGNQFKMHSL